VTLHDQTRLAVDAIAEHLKTIGGEGTAEVLARLAEQTLAATQPVAPQDKPVVRFMPDLLQMMAPASPQFASALGATYTNLCWLQSSSYTDDILGEGFGENYAWAELIGPKGVIPGNDFTMGILLLGPHLHYLDHYHPAPELYLPLTSGSHWKKGESAFIERRQGEVIWHPSMMIHATKTFAEPLLAIYVWTRDIATPAKLKFN
jgi:hypothetical protein